MRQSWGQAVLALLAFAVCIQLFWSVQSNPIHSPVQSRVQVLQRPKKKGGGGRGVGNSQKIYFLLRKTSLKLTNCAYLDPNTPKPTLTKILNSAYQPLHSGQEYAHQPLYCGQEYAHQALHYGQEYAGLFLMNSAQNRVVLPNHNAGSI